MLYLETISFPYNLDEFTEIIDVRSPEEFAVDHLPGAINLPVLSDSERKKIGILHKQSPFQARKLGAAYITRNVSDIIVKRLAQTDGDYSPLLYCWRGGLRSRSMATVLKSIGWQTTIIDGGYRAFRHHVVEATEAFFQDPELDIRVLSGLTGVGKTRLLKALHRAGAQVIDLEDLVNHRGSLLGEKLSEQPSQKQFETRLWDTIRQLKPEQPVYIEAESNRIGKLHCPAPLWVALSSARVIQVDLALEQRIQLLLEDYPHFQKNPEQLQQLLKALIRLRGHAQVETWQTLITTGDWPAFVRSILQNHYDLCYRQPGDEKSNYQAPEKTLKVASATTESFDLAARELMEDAT